MHPDYAGSLSEFGSPIALPASGGWVLEREIPGTGYRDAMGCYPLFVCRDWSRLASDLEALGTELVSLSLVTDPFGLYDEACLAQCFDRVIRFKQHYVVDLGRPMEEIVSKYSRRNARRALQKLVVERCEEPRDHLDEWFALYQALVERHRITGIRAFSRESFERQFCVPGVVMFRALSGRETVGAHLWYVQEDVAYSHLSAYSDTGYKLRAAAVLQWCSIEHLANEVRWLNQGAGTSSDASDGLSRFKQSFSTGTRTAFFCGRIINRDLYEELSRGPAATGTGYFPAYRNGEFRP